MDRLPNHEFFLDAMEDQTLASPVQDIRVFSLTEEDNGQISISVEDDGRYAISVFEKQ